ncbi:MAG: PepSY domain-containing protein [Motiliproteus sp.]|nr:PepSY domain-containing protein [Motiliproteus sp.]MCW9052617.1 PepSY domain-containing protein [Motiliproteus sp.]
MTSLVFMGWLSSTANASPLDQDDVVPMVEQGKVLPLEQILQTHRSRLKGRLIDLELEHEHGRLVYELEVIDDRGVVREFLIDAKTNEWLGEEH